MLERRNGCLGWGVSLNVGIFYLVLSFTILRICFIGWFGRIWLILGGGVLLLGKEGEKVDRIIEVDVVFMDKLIMEGGRRKNVLV